MGEQHTSFEAEEHLDLVEDNYIVDLMDFEDTLEDNNYTKAGDEDADKYDFKKIREETAEIEDYMKMIDEYMADEKSYEVNVANEIAASDVANGRSSPLKEEEDPVRLKIEVEDEKYAELLALPPHGSEIFIGGMPRDATEKDLRELFESYGEVFELRLMKDKDAKENKGFAFVTFTTKDAAHKAVEEIRHKEFKGRNLRCSLYHPKHKLFIGKIPKNLQVEELRKIFQESGPGVINIECFKDSQFPRHNRGFVFVEYYNHACAEYARRKMASEDFKLDGSTPSVCWADPQSPYYSSATAEVKTVFLKNLPENVTAEKVKEVFEHHGDITKLVLPAPKPGQKRDFGFLTFADRSSALKAVFGTEEYKINGQVVKAYLAKPHPEKKIDCSLNSHKLQLPPSYPTHPGGYARGPYGDYSGIVEYGMRVRQPIIIGRGPVPLGMRLVPMRLPDGRQGYVLRPIKSDASLPPPRSDRNEQLSDKTEGEKDKSHGSRYRPY